MTDKVPEISSNVKGPESSSFRVLVPSKENPAQSLEVWIQNWEQLQGLQFQVYDRTLQEYRKKEKQATTQASERAVSVGLNIASLSYMGYKVFDNLINSTFKGIDFENVARLFYSLPDVRSMVELNDPLLAGLLIAVGSVVASGDFLDMKRQIKEARESRQLSSNLVPPSRSGYPENRK